MSDKPISPLRQRMIDDMTARPFWREGAEGLRPASQNLRGLPRPVAVTLGRGRGARAARAHHEDSPSGQPRRTLRGWCGLSRPAEARAATSGHLDQHLRPPRPEANVPPPRGTGSAPLSVTSAGKVICSPFSVEGFPSRASVEGEHGETGLSLHRTMLSQADGGP